MRKSLIILVLAPFDLLASAVHDARRGIDRVCSLLARTDAFAEPPPMKLAMLDDPVIRQDLQRGQMPQQAMPTGRTVRPRRDQRPSLRLFTLFRNDFAF